MISILMPVYNGIEFINDSVPSVINQSYKDWELIIGINGHKENSQTYRIAKKYENKDNRIKVYDLIGIKGKSNALNNMIKYTKYNWISILDIDDIWLKDKLLLQIPYMNEYDIIGTHCEYFGERKYKPILPFGDISKIDFLEFNPIINSSCLLKKELCFWDKECNIEDYDLWIRLWKNGKKFFNINKCLVKHRLHNKSAFNSKGNHLHVSSLINKYKK